LQARKTMVNVLRKLLEERRASNETYHDMLGCLMARDENRYKLSDEEIIDLVITVIYSGYETVSTTSMMAVKYLHDHPKALEELRVSEKLYLSLGIMNSHPCDFSCFCADYVMCGIFVAERAFDHKREEKAWWGNWLEWPQVNEFYSCGKNCVPFLSVTLCGCFSK